MNQRFLELARQFPHEPKKIYDILIGEHVSVSLDAIRKRLSRWRLGSSKQVATSLERPFEGFVTKTYSLDRDITKIVALYDVHFPYNIDLNPIINFIRDYKPNIIILGGDIWSLDCISTWNKDRMLNDGRLNIREILHNEAKGLGELLDLIQKASPSAKVYYIVGNHEHWIQKFEDENPSFSRQEGLMLERLIDSDTRRIELIPFGGTLKIGKLHFKHGHEFGTQNAPKQALDRCRCSVVFGHFHTAKIWPAFSMVDAKTKQVAIQVPCLCKMAPIYGKGRPNDWQNGFLSVNMKRTGNFTAYLTLVSLKGHFMTQMGKEYT